MIRTRVNKNKTQIYAPHTAGVGLIEVLVALVVISLGVLGMAGLQLSGMKQTNSSFNRTRAVLLSENMAARMRINKTAVAAGRYGSFDSTQVNCGFRPTPYCQSWQGGPAQGCTSDEFAVFDQFSVACGDWGPGGASGGIADALPSGAKLTVTCDDSPCQSDSTHTLRVLWDEGVNASHADTVETVRVEMRLRP